MKKITEKELRVLNFIHEYYLECSYMPTRTDIAEHFKFHPNAAQYFCTTLHDKGCIEVIPLRSRAIKITEKGLRTLKEYGY